MLRNGLVLAILQSRHKSGKGEKFNIESTDFFGKFLPVLASLFTKPIFLPIVSAFISHFSHFSTPIRRVC